MKYLLLILALALVGAAVFKALFPGHFPVELIDKYNKQQNPFLIPKDSSEMVWARAKQFIEKRKRMIVGGALQQNDSLLYMPYYNDFHKGHSFRIEKKTIGDSVQFSVMLWYSGKTMDLGSKEFAFFMKTGIDNYNSNK